MAPESTPILALPPPAGGLLPTRDKVRIRFRKDGALRLLSHHDLMRCFERMLRRAALPIKQSKGFHPKPRCIFALSLPLGVIGCEEVVELELDEILPPEEVRERLERQLPAGMEILSLRRIDFKAGAQVHSLTYRIALPDDRVDEVARRAAELMAAPACFVERTKPEPRRVDLRPWLLDLQVVAGQWMVDSAGTPGSLPPTTEHQTPNTKHQTPNTKHQTPNTHLEIKLCLTPAGTARPEEVLTVLGIHDLLEAGAVLERIRLTLKDEG